GRLGRVPLGVEEDRHGGGLLPLDRPRLPVLRPLGLGSRRGAGGRSSRPPARGVGPREAWQVDDAHFEEHTQKVRAHWPVRGAGRERLRLCHRLPLPADRQCDRREPRPRVRQCANEGRGAPAFATLGRAEDAPV
ncbi:unnamed protein product, partial [Prorocentrum cordatum]